MFEILLLCVCFLFCIVGYIYRFAIITCILNIYSYYKIFMRKNNGFYKKEEMLLQKNDNGYCYLEEYYIVENGNEQPVIFISDKKSDVQKEVDHFKKDMNDFCNRKNIILYCGIIEQTRSTDDKQEGTFTEGSESKCIGIEDDITKDFRSFIYYYDKDHFKLGTFFCYLNINSDSVFILYKNDNNFTEKRYIVKDIEDKRFKDILLD
jgi:hypothetical protein